MRSLLLCAVAFLCLKHVAFAQNSFENDSTLHAYRKHHYIYSPENLILRDSVIETNFKFGNKEPQAFLITYQYNSKNQLIRKCDRYSTTFYKYNVLDSIEYMVELNAFDDTLLYEKSFYANNRLSSKTVKRLRSDFSILDYLNRKTLKFDSTNYQYRYANGQVNEILITSTAVNELERHEFEYKKGKLAAIIKYKRRLPENWKSYETIRFNRKNFDYVVIDQNRNIIANSKPIVENGEKSVRKMISSNLFLEEFFNEKGQKVRVVMTSFNEFPELNIDEVSDMEWISTFDEFGNELEEFVY